MLRMDKNATKYERLKRVDEVLIEVSALGFQFLCELFWLISWLSLSAQSEKV